MRPALMIRIKSLKPKSIGDTEAPEEGREETHNREDLLDIAKDILSAIKSESAEELADTLAAFFLQVDSEGEDEE